MTSYIYPSLLWTSCMTYMYNNIISLYYYGYSYINMIYCFIDVQDDYVTLLFIGYHDFFTLLPGCYCGWISLDVHPHDQHIKKI